MEIVLQDLCRQTVSTKLTSTRGAITLSHPTVHHLKLVQVKRPKALAPSANHLNILKRKDCIVPRRRIDIPELIWAVGKGTVPDFFALQVTPNPFVDQLVEPFKWKRDSGIPENRGWSSGEHVTVETEGRKAMDMECNRNIPKQELAFSNDK